MMGLFAGGLMVGTLPGAVSAAVDSFLGRDFVVTTSEGCVGIAHVGLGSRWGRNVNPSEAIKEANLGECGHVVSIVPK
jgi:hypothetical protein